MDILMSIKATHHLVEHFVLLFKGTRTKNRIGRNKEFKNISYFFCSNNRLKLY